MIELTGVSGNKITMIKTQITCVVEPLRSTERTLVWLCGDNQPVPVKETYERVREILKNANTQ